MSVGDMVQCITQWTTLAHSHIALSPVLDIKNPLDLPSKDP